MKHGKKPTAAQRKLLLSKRLDPGLWLVVKDTTYEMVVVHRYFDGNTRTIVKADRCRRNYDCADCDAPFCDGGV